MKSQLGEKSPESKKDSEGIISPPLYQRRPENWKEKKKKKGSELQKTLGSNTGAKSIIQQAAPPAYTHSSISSAAARESVKRISSRRKQPNVNPNPKTLGDLASTLSVCPYLSQRGRGEKTRNTAEE